VDLTDDPAAGLQLHSAAAEDLAIHLPGHRHRRGRHLGVNVGLRIDEDRPPTLDLTLDRATNADRVLRLERPIDGRVLAGGALDLVVAARGRRPAGRTGGYGRLRSRLARQRRRARGDGRLAMGPRFSYLLGLVFARAECLREASPLRLFSLLEHW